jgi:diguanylate cyclase (GGDEF)-like protein
MESAVNRWLPQPEIKPKLLIVDDQVINIRVLRELFHKDCQLYMARDGEQALELAHTILPDLILLDVVMPQLDGFDVCRMLKNDEMTAHIPIIFITGNITDNDETKGFDLGAVDFIRKPFNPLVTRARVRNHLLLKRQSDMLAKIALSDGLTGLPNRRCFDQELSEAWRRSARERWDLSVLMLDVDFFKRFNDHFGHQAGDDCLRQVGAALASALQRPGDLLARYGGEEFSCVLSHTDQQGAEHMAELFVNAVRELEIPHPASQVADIVTISVGLASVVPGTEVDTSELLVAAADARLYRAKSHGRNQVCS